MRRYVQRTFRIPNDLYEVMNEKAEIEELDINKFTIKLLRKVLNVPVKVKKDNK